MAVPQIVEGRLVVFELGNGASPETFTPLCGVNVNSWNQQVQTTDRFLRDCDNPTAVPTRSAIATGIQEDITLSGYFTLDNRPLLESILGQKRNIRLTIYHEDGVTEAGYYEGRQLVTARNMSAPENDAATIEIVLANDGPLLTWTAAPPPVLASLTVTPLTASEGSPWVGTIAGKTPGSVISASASDSTPMLVSPDGATVSGTFATAGSKTVTLIETHSVASGSPKTNTAIVVVS